MQRVIKERHRNGKSLSPRFCQIHHLGCGVARSCEAGGSAVLAHCESSCKAKLLK